MTIRIPAYAAEIYETLKEDPEIVKMQGFACHGGISVYDHSLSVAKMACRIANMFHMRPERYGRLVQGGLLHDFYGYDYHGCRTKMGGWHAWRHPERALDNARRLLRTDRRLDNVIRAHMFPGTLFHMPVCSEAWAVNLADKICSVLEYLHITACADAVIMPA